MSVGKIWRMQNTLSYKSCQGALWLNGNASIVFMLGAFGLIYAMNWWRSVLGDLLVPLLDSVSTLWRRTRIGPIDKKLTWVTGWFMGSEYSAFNSSSVRMLMTTWRKNITVLTCFIESVLHFMSGMVLVGKIIGKKKPILVFRWQ
jgi:hypothetical protein